ncbi:LuxR C-terminal-related transcriptional regulator [Glutamicibacter sp. NPDC087344]|uniref:helix-turn-helix transcriptional regulator n=1 Tax=Glutamicibacter sp. NPDC087344 TaxID=3363994 RepID=UPI003826041B
MTGFQNERRAVLPSRVEALNTALDVARSGGPILIIGDAGTGRTTFSLQLMDRIDSKFIWIVGSKALSSVPFSTLSVLATQLPEGSAGTTPTALVTGIARATSEHIQWVFLDHAEHVDEQSAAVLKQYSISGNIRLVIAASSVRSMPSELRSMISSPNLLRVDLEPLTYDDAQMMLGEILGGEVNSSTITSLLEFAGGHALHLRELSLDARASGALTKQHDYWTLSRTWTPRGKRTSELINARLSNQTENVREALELLAVTGPVPLEVALKLVGQSVYEAIETELVRLDVISENPVTGERVEQVRLGTGLSSELVFNSFDASTLRRHVRTIDEKLTWELFDSAARSRFTRHRLDMGLTVPIDELLSDVRQASGARQFDQVIALTDLLDRQLVESALQLETLLVARAEALSEFGMPEAALTLLQEHLATGSPELRFVAAKIAYASLGRLETAEQFLQALPGDPPGVAAYLLLIRSRANKVVDVAALRRYASMPELRSEGRAAILAHVLVEQAHAGLAEDSMAEYVQLTESAQWKQWPASVRSELIFAFPTIAFALGLNPARFADLSLGEDLKTANTCHGNVIVGIGMGYLESGLAEQALACFEQAIGLFAVGDPNLVKGFAAALAAAAATLLGERQKASLYLAMSRAEPEVSGQISRPVADRCLLSVILDLDGAQAAQVHLREHLSAAEAFGRKNLVMRLLLEAWQCGLLGDVAQLSEAARQVQGPLAAVLSGYEDALKDPTELSVVPLVQAHVEAGQLLLAAQLAARASEQARILGRRAVATHLLGLSVEIGQPLEQVNTFAWGRARIDSSLLTAREYATCVLAAKGASSLEISKELFLSTRTVEGHLQRSYTKLGITDRRQLIAERADVDSVAPVDTLGLPISM